MLFSPVESLLKLFYCSYGEFLHRMLVAKLPFHQLFLFSNLKFLSKWCIFVFYVEIPKHDINWTNENDQVRCFIENALILVEKHSASVKEISCLAAECFFFNDNVENENVCEPCGLFPTTEIMCNIILFKVTLFSNNYHFIFVFFGLGLSCPLFEVPFNFFRFV